MSEAAHERTDSACGVVGSPIRGSRKPEVQDMLWFHAQQLYVTGVLLTSLILPWGGNSLLPPALLATSFSVTAHEVDAEVWMLCAINSLGYGTDIFDSAGL